MHGAKLLIATGNAAKINYYLNALSDLPIKLVTLKDLGITQKFEESGSTFEENAIAKARFYSKVSGLPALSDDGGFEIDALNGEPGVKSRRWPGYEGTDEELIQMALDKLKGMPSEKRTARIRSVTALVTPDGREFTAEGTIEGVISEKPAAKRIEGFPFRSILVVGRFNKFYVDLSEEEYAELDHRKSIVEKVKHFLKDIIFTNIK